MSISHRPPSKKVFRDNTFGSAVRSAHDAIDRLAASTRTAPKDAAPTLEVRDVTAEWHGVDPLSTVSDFQTARQQTHWGRAFAKQLQNRDFAWYGDVTQIEASLLLALELMGGPDVFIACPASRSDLHHLILQGVPGKALDWLMSHVATLSREQVGEAVGLSTRTLRRRMDAPDAPLSPEQGGRAFRFAELLARAAVVLGSQEEAERWFDTPAMGLDQQKPLALIATQVGAQLVDDFLGRLEHGVYA
ncbi:MAG: antitoxin [Rhizobacter sp.]|jgi:putative toxin-antitoxin system antitoxin component (TIGR02293 family)|nr:antitoxin [Rhizobacter sp.]